MSLANSMLKFGPLPSEGPFEAPARETGEITARMSDGEGLAFEPRRTPPPEHAEYAKPRTTSGGGALEDDTISSEPLSEQKPELEPSQPASDFDFRQLVAEANGGDPEALRRLRETLDTQPQIWQRIGDLAAHARLTLIRAASAGDQLLIESLLRTAEAMEKELLGGELGKPPSSLERLSVSRVVSTWLQAQHADAMAGASHDNLSWAKFWAQQQDRAHRRHLAAIKQLAAVRQMPASKLPTGKEAREPKDQQPQDADVRTTESGVVGGSARPGSGGPGDPASRTAAILPFGVSQARAE